MADEYISREAALTSVCGGCGVEFSDEPCEPSDCEIMARLKAIPAADVKPVMRGKWIDTCVRDWTCSVCKGKIDKVRHVDGYYYKDLPNFCPDCGADMREEKHEQS